MKINKLGLFALLAATSFACTQIGSDSKTQSSSRFAVDYVVLVPETLANIIQITGSLLPAESAMLSAQASGQISEILFTEGQKVEKGQLLVKLDERQWIAQRQKLQAQLETAKRDADRKKQLAEINGVSQAVIDEAELAIANIEADIQELNIMIDYAAIRAPFSGQIGLRNVSPGSYLQAGDPVARLVKLDRLKLEFNVPERYAAEIKLGQPVQFRIAGSQQTFDGKVYAVEPAISETSRALKIRAEVPNANQELIAGAFAEISLTLDSIFDALLLPSEAIIPKLNSQSVFQITAGKVHEIQVETGIRQARLTQVVEGLNRGDTIMVTGLLQAKEGMPVAPANRMLTTSKVAL